MKKPQLKVRIMHLMGAYNLVCKASWLAEKLNATVKSIRAALKGLVRYGMLEIIRPGVNGRVEAVYAVRRLPGFQLFSSIIRTN